MLRININRLAAAALVLALAASCGADRWGTPEYFERLTGVRFAPDGQVVRCQLESGPDVAAFIKVRLSKNTIRMLNEQAASMSNYPRQLDYERERRLQRWGNNPLSDEGKAILDWALLGADHAIEQSKCGVSSQEARKAVLQALGRSTTLYSFQYKRVGADAGPEALDFRILDLAEGVLYELVNFS
jgi:hypothetical protein